MSLITGLLIAGLDWTGLDWNPKIRFYALWHAIAMSNYLRTSVFQGCIPIVAQYVQAISYVATPAGRQRCSTTVTRIMRMLLLGINVHGSNLKFVIS